jgi:hypothetical protein
VYVEADKLEMDYKGSISGSFIRKKLKGAMRQRCFGYGGCQLRL